MEPRQIVAERPMTTMQWVAVAICVALNALDGFDILAISFASPGIAAEWGIDRAALGIVLSMELIGMAVGSVVLGNVTDKVGRRPTILGCLIVMAGGMAMATTAHDVTSLSIWRFLTGIGIGGMLAATNAMVAEFANAKNKSLAVAIMAIGYPMGAVLGGSIATRILVDGTWRDVFAFGAVVTAVLLPVAWFLLPESVSYLDHRRPANALERINRTLRRIGQPTVQALPVLPPDAPRPSVADLFAPAYRATTIRLTIVYFAHVLTFYYTLKWVPKIVVDFGHTAAEAGQVLVWANVGGFLGGLSLGLLTVRFGLKPLLLVYMVAGFVLVTLFGQTSGELGSLTLLVAAAGFCTNAVIVGMYAVFARAFPTPLRASGTGFAVGIGRGGSALAPIIAGFLFAGGYGLPVVSAAMALGTLVAAFVLWGLVFDERRAAD